MQFKRITDLREERDFSQKHVAAELSCDQSLYSKYERGVRDVPLFIMIKLSLLYNTSIDYITGMTDERRRYP